MLDLVRRYHLTMRMSTLLFWRSLIIVNSTVLRFPGTVDPLTSSREFFEPTPTEIAADFVGAGLDSRRTLTAASLLRAAPIEIQRTLDDAARSERQWLTETDEAGPVFRANNRRARGIALALVGLSLGIVGTGQSVASLDTTLRLVALVIVVPVAVWSFAELSPR